MAPLLRRERHRRASRMARRLKWSHDDRRVLLHRYGWVDPERVWLANIMIAMPACWTGLFGDPRAICALSYYVPNVIRFPPAADVVRQLEGSNAL